MRSSRHLRQLADDFMSLFVRHRGGWVCQHCGSRKWWEMQMAHLVPKENYPATRYREDNAICLCKRCHKAMTHRPIEWREWLVRRMGLARVEQLEMEGRIRCGPHDYVAVVVFYWHKLMARPDREKIAERVRELVVRANGAGIPLGRVA